MNLYFRVDYLASKTAILENAKLSSKTKNRLISVATMESLVNGVTSKITTHGNIVYTLPSGGKICDTGKRISFSPEAKEMALAYMASKWGIRHRSVDRATGDTVYTLISGQKVYDRKEARVFERPDPTPRRERIRNRGMER